MELGFENMQFNVTRGTFNDKIKLDCKTDLLTDDVERVLDVSAFAVLTEKEILMGKLKYGGNVICQICYLDKSGALRKYECGNEYLGVITAENITETDTAVAFVKTEKADVDLSGLKATVSVVLSVTATVYATENLNAVCGGDGIILNKQDFPVVKSYGVKTKIYPLEEEFELDFAVKQVLCHGVKGVITNVQCGVGCIIADGEVVLSALYLSSTDEIIRQNKTFPFRMEIEYDEAMPVMRASARVREKSFKSDISVDGETGKSTVSLGVALIFEGEVFYDETITLATDAFCVTDNLEVTSETFCAVRPCEMRSFSREACGRALINELPNDTAFVTACGEKVEVVNYSASQGEINVSGIVSATGFFKDGDGKVFSVPMETPFTVVLDMGDCACENVEIFATLREVSVKMISLTETEFCADVYLSVYPSASQSVKYVKGVKPCGEKAKETHAISVYIPLEGEELWSLAKRLNVCPDEVIATNKDLQFPLTGKERIVIYRQMC